MSQVSKGGKHDFDSENSRSSNGGSADDLSEKRSFIIYKYFVLSVAIFEAISCSLTFVDMINYSKKLIIFYAFNMILSFWDAYQLRILYLSIKRKDIDLARKAVQLIRLYMIVFPILALLCIYINPPLTKGRRAVVSQEIYYVSQVLMIFGAELFMGTSFLFGATKVKNLLES